jgi:hypothetical protein
MCYGGEKYLSNQFVFRITAGLAGLCLVSALCVGQEPAPTAPAQPPPSTQNQPAASGQRTPGQNSNPADPDKVSRDKSNPDKTSPDTASDKAATGQDAGATDKSSSKSSASSERLLFAMPNFLTVANGGKVPPLTPKQKFGLVARGAFDSFQYPWYGAIALLGQAQNTEPAYGQGLKGYGKRYATSFADGTIENFIVGAAFPSILHQDPRFYQSEDGSVAHRAGYAVSRIFVTRSDSGHKQFNYSEIFGSATASAISTFSYHPRSTFVTTPEGIKFIPSDRTLSNAASVWASQVGYDTLTILIKEFWPDIQRKLVHKHANGAVSPDSVKP